MRLKRLLLAVSGGLDSISLAHYFITNKEHLGIEWLGIAHVHHGLREGSADRDAEFVKQFAKSNGIPFFVKKLDGKALKAANGSLEENARNARYEALKAFAQENQADAIVTAHHASDQAETLYLRLRRGVSLAGLRGIQQEGILPNTPTLYIYRPFLNTPKSDIVKYAEEHNLTWCEDETNSDTKYARNKIRHNSLPHLESIAPGATLQLCHIAELAHKAYEKVLATASTLFTPAIIDESGWPFKTEYKAFRNVLALDLGKINAILASKAEISSGMRELFRLWLCERGFRLPLQGSGDSLPIPFPQKMQCKSVLIEQCRNILWFCDTTSAITHLLNPKNYYFEDEMFSCLNGAWRYRQDGDMLAPNDKKIRARKLTQWLHEQGIPKWMFDSLPLFACGSKVLYVEGMKKSRASFKK